MNRISIRVNGKGNAWPISLGQAHSFYDKENIHDLANASYSIFKKKEKLIEKSLLIDAGHGTTEFLIRNENRLPDAIFLTHPHIDHTLGVDWIAQSSYRFLKIKLPLYASRLCWEQTTQNFPQLKKIIEFKELLPGIEKDIDEFPGISVVFYPVFHGESAQGAGMLLFKISGKKSLEKVLFTGDLLCPLLRTEDIHQISGCKAIYVDSNNLLPCPQSNHWSFVFPEKIELPRSVLFSNWFNEKGKNLSWLCRPNLPLEFNSAIHNYFDTFLKEQISGAPLFFSILDFVKEIKPELVNIIHYSGIEDYRNYNHDILNETNLGKWIQKALEKLNFKTSYKIPKSGDEMNI